MEATWTGNVWCKFYTLHAQVFLNFESNWLAVQYCGCAIVRISHGPSTVQVNVPIPLDSMNPLCYRFTRLLDVTTACRIMSCPGNVYFCNVGTLSASCEYVSTKRLLMLRLGVSKGPFKRFQHSV